MKIFYTLLLFILFTNSILASSKKDPAKTVRSYKLNEPIILDGKLTESVYQNPPIMEFTQKNPDEGKPATEESHIWISHDESNIYFGGKFFDSQPDSIDLSLMRRDNMTDPIGFGFFWTLIMMKEPVFIFL